MGLNPIRIQDLSVARNSEFMMNIDMIESFIENKVKMEFSNRRKINAVAGSP